MDPLEALSAAECWALLAQHRVGRIAFTERALPAILPLNYAVVGGRVMLRVRAEGLAARLDGQIVAFEIDEVDDDNHAGWSVVVTGAARLLARVGELARADSVPPSWAGEDHQTVVAITPGDVQGRRLLPRVGVA
jgi:nitroimidazol reductase NimA-like FMN-containing flavoprotein (pyridoxamine 5'-phosphate oxidase superfamily)